MSTKRSPKSICSCRPGGVSKRSVAPPGTHLSIALGREAILAVHSVQSTTATALVAGPAKAHSEKRLDEKPLGLQV